MIQIPVHLPQTDAFRALKRCLNSERNANYVVSTLFTELALQADEHGIPGLLRAECVPSFVEMLNEYDDFRREKVMEYLIRANWIVLKGNDYFCAIFARYNSHLSEIHHSNERAEKTARSFTHYARKAEKDLPEDFSLIYQLTDVWTKADGGRLTPDQMNRALTLIRIIDLTMGRKARREKEEFNSGLIISAHAICDQFSKEMLEAILKRIIYLRDTGEIPRRTEAILKDFDAIYYRLLPVNGWLDWQRTV